MTHRESFSEDWARVVGAPLLPHIAITAADPGGDAVKAGDGGLKTAESGATARDALDDRGGLRGFGCEKVSAAERATLDRLGSALG
jgi:hypothetical protein